MGSELTFAAVGDIAFAGALADRSEFSVFSKVVPIFEECEFVIGNLENPLVRDGKPTEGKCTLRGTPEWAGMLRSAHLGVVSLANNHLMDYGEVGLFSTMDALDKAEVKYVGAGRDREEACAPLFLETNGKEVAVLARTSVAVSSPSYAGIDNAGVAFFDVRETIERIKECKQLGKAVVLSIHWGIEEYAYPSPEQRRLARELVMAGADVLIGHHPHVLQGIERIKGGLVCYSLGNFLFDDVEWSFVDEVGRRHNLVSRLSPENRKGGILRVSISKRGVQSCHLVPSLISAGNGILIEQTDARRSHFQSLCEKLVWPGYNFFWMIYSMRQEWLLRIKPLFAGRSAGTILKAIRPRHLKLFIDRVKRAVRITSEKTTNPYE